MKQFLIFLTSLLIGTVWAQPITTKKEVYCDKTDTIISILKGKDFEEVPIWLGKSDENTPNYSLFVNTETRSWTIIQFNNNLACVLGAGESYQIPTKKSYT